MISINATRGGFSKEREPQQQPMKHIQIKTNKGAMNAEVIRENSKTWIVRLPDGNIIKRHKVKHSIY